LIESIGEKGLLASFGTEHLSRYGKVTRDDHGHLRLGEIEFGRMMKDLLTAQLEKFGMKVTLIDKDLGYELRCANPIPFDVEYTRDLGYGAVKFLLSPDAEKFGAIISFVDGRMELLPFDTMLNPQTNRMQVRKVNVEGEAYECARHYDPSRALRFRGSAAARKAGRDGEAFARAVPPAASIPGWSAITATVRMNNLAGCIDHTLLKPEATAKDIEKLCSEARDFRFFSVCINGSRLELARHFLSEAEVKLTCVVGFPLARSKRTSSVSRQKPPSTAAPMKSTWSSISAG
jgi:hypothetical protein